MLKYVNAGSTIPLRKIYSLRPRLGTIVYTNVEQRKYIQMQQFIYNKRQRRCPIFPFQSKFTIDLVIRKVKHECLIVIKGMKYASAIPNSTLQQLSSFLTILSCPRWCSKHLLVSEKQL